MSRMALLAPYPCSRCRFFVGWRLTPYPTYGPYHCELKLSTLSLSPWLLKLPVLVTTGPEYRGLRRYRHTAVKAELGLRTEDQRRFRLAELAHPLADIFSGNLLRQIQIVLIVTRLGAQQRQVELL